MPINNPTAASSLALATSVDDLESWLAGAAGIASFPVAAAPANDVSLAEVIRSIWAAQQGTAAGENGITTWPAAAAPGNTVSLAEALRFVVESQIGTLANAGGVATLAAMLGDPANSSLVARLALLYTDSQKIAAANAGGLAATADSLAYGIGEIERHFHGWERWMCKAASVNGEIHVADRIGAAAGSTVPFTVTSGDSTWGSWVQILGSSDTPVVTGRVKYDLHRVQIMVANTVAPYFLQIGFGASGAAAVTADSFSSIIVNPASNTDKTVGLPLMSRRQAAGTKAWARCWCVGQDAKTLTIMFGLHEYEG